VKEDDDEETSSYITATEVCELNKKIAAEYMGQLLYLTLNFARYQKCKLMQELADKLGLILVYIPP
jgi:hypothetical protein